MEEQISLLEETGYQELDGYEDSGIECPACEQVNMRVVPIGTGVDDMINYLRCPNSNCNYEEQE